MPPITFDDILAARARLAGAAHLTPVMTSRTLDTLAGCAVVLKCEQLQRGGAFKFRGAYNVIAGLSAAARTRGVVAFSSGNHAQGVALAAQLLGVAATICMPHDAPAVKVAATRGYGADVRVYDRFRDDREVFARAVAAEHDATIIPPYDDPQIMAGQGTAALELVEQAPGLDTILVPISGGGLMAGAAVAAHGKDPRITMLGVEPEEADDTRQSLVAGRRVTIAAPQTIADGLRVTSPGALTFPIMQQHVAAVMTVREDEIRAAVRFALLRLKLVLEPSGAVGLAAALSGRLPAEARRVGIILSGGNIDPAQLAAIVAEA